MLKSVFFIFSCIILTSCGTDTGKKIFSDTQRNICQDSCAQMTDSDAQNACMKRCMYE
jgi:hypothetical protein